MKKFWKKYGLLIHIGVLAAAIILMIFFRFWEEVPEKRGFRWFQFVLFLIYLIERVKKLIDRKKVTNNDKLASEE